MSVIDIKMSAIYKAAHEECPAKAHAFAAEAGLLSSSIDGLVTELNLAGNHPIGGDLADVAVELFIHMRSMVKTFNDTAVGLDRIADDFVKTDQQAKAWLDKHRSYVGDPDTADLPTAPKV
ncbi:hypothetical protein [Nocardioides sp. GXZ039]|uniref:hypothetical protein n=1 Tax=Nocardioides sp. GXZ039 TaxID=3136018 RepID=UPI0030F451EB